MDSLLDFAEESLRIGVLRLREVNEVVRIRELEIAEGADGLSESTDLSDSTRERLRAGRDRLRNRSPEFLEELQDLEADLRTAVTVGRMSEPEARVASWRGADRLERRIARLGEQVLLRWMHLDRVERLILQLMGEQDLKSLGVTEFPWPERRRTPLDRLDRPKPSEKQHHRWWPFGRSRRSSETDAAVAEALEVLRGASDQARDDNDAR